MPKLRFPPLANGPLKELMDHLHRLHGRAGWPSVRKIARGVGVSHDTVHSLFTSPTLPNAPILLRIAEFLAIEAGVDADSWCDRIDELWTRADSLVHTTPNHEEGIDRSPYEPLDGFSNDADIHTATSRIISASPTQRPGWSTYDQQALPQTIFLSRLIGSQTVESVRHSWEHWATQGGAEVGMGQDGEPFLVDIVRDGPHALLAGTSGSGKSELLRTLIIALAVRNPPHRLNVLFVDYKGGATVSGLRGLPHLVGVVTNLDGRSSRRMIAGLRSEIDRRQRAMLEADAGSLEAYWRLQRTLPSSETIPRLLVIVDELAEVKQQLPAFVDELVVAARVGRAVGIHLILATQRPAGVVTESIRANCNLRVCLRVADESDSVDVLGVPDASRIPKLLPGRALVSVGNSRPVLIQTALCTRDQETLAPSSPEELTSVIHQATSDDIRQLISSPILPPLPDVVTLASLKPQELTICLGRRDDLSKRRQDMFDFPLGSGHLLLVGSSRSGRTSALRSIAAGLAISTRCDSVHIYAISKSAELAGLRALPHVGGVITQDDPQTVKRVMLRLAEEVNNRLHALETYGVSHIDELGNAAPPRWVVLIDDWRQVGIPSNSSVQAALLEILTSGVKTGVTVCLTSDERLTRSRLITFFTHRLCFRLNDPNDGLRLGLSPSSLPVGLPPGRAIWAADEVEVQLPLLANDASAQIQALALADLASKLLKDANEVDPLKRPLKIEAIPTCVELQVAYELGGQPSEGIPGVLLGVSASDRLSAIWTDLASGAIIVAGTRGSGRSNAAKVIALSGVLRGLRVLMVTSMVQLSDDHLSENLKLVRHNQAAVGLDWGPDLVIVDDAENLATDGTLVERLEAPSSPFLAVVAHIDAFGLGARGIIKSVRRRTGGIVLLSPPNHLAASNVGVEIGRDDTFTGPPGRALVRIGDWQILGQVPLAP